jgi:hypothetical protein
LSNLKTLLRFFDYHQTLETKMSANHKITNYKKVNSKLLRFGKIQPRGTFYFVSTSYQGQPLTIETPALITPTGIDADEARNFMDLELDVATNYDHQDLYDLIKSVDDRCIDESIDNMSKWFKGDVDEQFIEEQFKSPITAGWGNEPSLLRVEIVSENPEDMIDSKGNVISPSDVSSLSSVKVKLQLLGIWASQKFLGCHWRAIGVVANLDHESKGRRRASSPRREASPLPPVTTRTGGRTKATTKAKAIETKATTKSSSQTALDRRSRIESMLERFKTEKTSGSDSSNSVVPTGSTVPTVPTVPTDQKSRYYSDDDDSDDDRRSYSDSEDDRRRSYSDDDRRRSYSYSDSEDDRRRSYSGDSVERRSYQKDNRYSDDDSYQSRRRSSDYSDYSSSEGR